MTGDGSVRIFTCSKCKCDLPENDFYRKGARIESCCRNCVLNRKARKRLEKKSIAAKQKWRRRNTQMVDLGSVRIRIETFAAADPDIVRKAFEHILETLQCRNES